MLKPLLDYRKRFIDDKPYWHDELVLITKLASISRHIAAYVLRCLDADAGRAEAISADDEPRLGARLIEAGTAVQARATVRLGGLTQIVVIL